jgi:alkylhydroperoxidase family enzyme
VSSSLRLVPQEISTLLDQTTDTSMLARTTVRRLMANNPTLVPPISVLLEAIMVNGGLPALDREILILRSAWRCNCDFVFQEHRLIALTCGLDERSVAALSGAEPSEFWSDRDRTLISAADDLCEHNGITTETWDRLSAFYNPSSLVEITIVVGTYRMMAGFVNSAGLTPEIARTLEN